MMHQSKTAKLLLSTLYTVIIVLWVLNKQKIHPTLSKQKGQKKGVVVCVQFPHKDHMVSL